MSSYRELYQTVLSEHQRVFEAQDETELNSAMDAIRAANRIFVVGAGREGIAARSFAMRLMHLGKEVHWLWDDTTPGMQKGDLFIAVNGSGKIGHIDYLLDQAKQTGARRLVITGSPGERTPQEADHVLFLPACVYKGTDTRVVIMVILLGETMGLTAAQMESRHRNIE